MKENILIVGAGVCGMTLGYKLAEAGYPTTIVEKAEVTGGLARTYYYDGYYFDSGPHRFFSSNQEIISFLKEIFQDDLATSPMKSAVYFLGNYYDWPLDFRVISKLPIKIFWGVLKDSLKKLINSEKSDPQNFKEYIIQKYGKTLYELDFGPYTEKFTKLPNEMIHSDWAKAGVNRAVIKEDIKMNTLFDVIKTSLEPKHNVYIYYPKNGISEFHDKLRDYILQQGGEILLNRQVDSFIIEEQKIKKAKIVPDDVYREFDTVVWTAPINEISGLLNVKKHDLDYLNIVTYNFFIRGTPRYDYQWIYYIDSDIPFNRLYNTVLFSQESAPEGYYGLCVEITCYEGDPVWENPSSLRSEIIDSLIKVKLIASPDEIIEIHYEKLEKAYPIYKTNYRKELKENIDQLYKIKNLILAGRTGLFWYNNMDHSIENAFQVAEDIFQGKRTSEVINYWE